MPVTQEQYTILIRNYLPFYSQDKHDKLSELGVTILMKKTQLSILIAAWILCGGLQTVYGEDQMVPDTDEASQQQSPAPEDEGQFLSADGLFEVVSETQSKKGEALEDVLPQPRTAQVPAEPPSSSLTVHSPDPYPSPSAAMIACSDEFQNADYRYFSERLFYTCTLHETETGFYYLTHVIIRDPKQIRGEDSYGDFAGTREEPADAALRTGAKVLVNGSYFRYDTGFATGGELLIRNGKVMHGPWSDGYEICLREDGTLFSPGYNTVESVLAQNVVFSWGTCEDLLIRDGEKCALTDYDWNGFPYPRTAIGMVRPLEYYLITAGGADYTGGITIYEEQEIFSSLGCYYARGLDGGASSALVLEGQYVNENGDRTDQDTLIRRPNVDFLLFTE